MALPEVLANALTVTLVQDVWLPVAVSEDFAEKEGTEGVAEGLPLPDEEPEGDPPAVAVPVPEEQGEGVSPRLPDAAADCVAGAVAVAGTLLETLTDEDALMVLVSAGEGLFVMVLAPPAGGVGLPLPPVPLTLRDAEGDPEGH